MREPLKKKEKKASKQAVIFAMFTILAFLGLAATASSALPKSPRAAASVPSVLLKNAAAPNTLMPATGAGSGGYTGNASQGYGDYPECFNGCEDAQCAVPDSPSFSSCAEYVDASMSTWMQLGGTRLDNSNSYHNQFYVAKAMRGSGLPREQLFLTSKVGPYLPLGYADAKAQFETTRNVTGLAYVDLLLIHWPVCIVEGCESQDPACDYKAASYNASECRLQTWRALVEIFNGGGARAIGVSNYNTSHLDEIIAAGLPLPAVNQVPFNIWHSADAQSGGLLDYCKAHSIVFNGYSPFAVPDRRVYPAPFPKTMLEDAALVQIAAAHQRSAAEVALAWQWQLGIVVNPRSQNAAHQWCVRAAIAAPPPPRPHSHPCPPPAQAKP
jgi:diketogulonate reductase-like aldo/keto reductase